MERHAHELAPPGVKTRGAPASHDVVCLPGGAWALASQTGDMLFTDYGDAVVKTTDGNVATGIQSVNMFGAYAGLTGIGAAAGLATAVPAMRKTVADGASWLATLAADVAALIQPMVSGNQPTPIDRVFSGKVDYDANTGFRLALTPPGQFWGEGCFFRLLFGGQADVTPRDATGGQWSLSFYADGRALLEELDQSQPASPAWQPRHDFEWAENGRASDTIHTVQVIPYASDRMAFLTRVIGGIAGGIDLRFGVLPVAIMKPGSRGNSFYRDTYQKTGHTHLSRMTGKGPVRIEIARTYRKVFGLARVKHPASGLLVDAPLAIKGPLPANTPITVSPDGFLPPNTSFTVGLYDADTHALLSTNGAGQFLSHANQRRYYVRVTFATSDRFQTPVLFGIRFDVAGYITTEAPSIITGGKIISISATGPDLEPGYESCGLELKDPFDALAILRVRDQVPADVLIVNPNTGALKTVLFSGRAVDGSHKLIGKPSRFPHWRDYDHVHLMAPWSTLDRQVPTSLHVFLQEPGAPDGTAWTVPNVLRLALNDCGFPNSYLSVPSYYEGVRLWNSPGLSMDAYMLQPGGTGSYRRLITDLCRDYLQAVFCWDPNAGPLDGSGVPQGMWRILPNPAPPYTNVLAHFVTVRPGGSIGKGGTSPGTYGANTTWIEEGTYEAELKGPEVNYVHVTGVANFGDDGQPDSRCENEWYNFRSHLFYAGQPIAPDPTHPDYLGFESPAHVLDLGLYGQAAVDYTIRLIARKAGHGQFWPRWRSPLLLVTDPLDPVQTMPRHLRINDLITIDGGLAIIRHCDPQWDRSDRVQMAQYHAMLLTNTAATDEPWVRRSDRAHLREEVRGAALAQIGVGADAHATFAPQTRGVLDKAAAMRLPLDMNNQEPLQNDAGENVFMVGADTVGGASPVA